MKSDQQPHRWCQMYYYILHVVEGWYLLSLCGYGPHHGESVWIWFGEWWDNCTQVVGTTERSRGSSRGFKVETTRRAFRCTLQSDLYSTFRTVLGNCVWISSSAIIRIVLSPRHSRTSWITRVINGVESLQRSVDWSHSCWKTGHSFLVVDHKHRVCDTHTSGWRQWPSVRVFVVELLLQIDFIQWRIVVPRYRNREKRAQHHPGGLCMSNAWNEDLMTSNIRRTDTLTYLSRKYFPVASSVFVLVQ